MKILKPFLLLLTLCFLTGCEKEVPEKPLSIGTNLWPGYEMIYLAENQGKYDPARVSIHQKASASDVMQTFMSGEINAAGLTLDETLQLIDKGYPLEIIAITDVSDGGDMVLSKPEIKTPYDLVGKTIGVEETALGAYMLARFLQYANIKDQDIKTKAITIDQHETAYQTGEVDAVISFDPPASKIKATGANLLFSSKNIPNEIIDVIVISAGDNKPSDANIQHFLSGYYQARQAFITEPETHLPFISHRLGLTPEETSAAYTQLKLPSDKDSLALMSVGGVMINSLTYMSFILEKEGIIKQGCDCRSLINMHYLSAIKHSANEVSAGD
jgi:NitT/TauT family transport system substrate-binding protein